MRHMIKMTALAAVVGSLVLVGCGSEDDGADKQASTTTEAATLEISDVWARESPDATDMGAAYMTITSPVDDALLGASAPKDIAGTTEVHETIIQEGESDDDMDTSTSDDMATTSSDDMSATTSDDMASDTGADDMGSDDMGNMTMQEVERIELPAGKAVALEPGGYHVMLLDLVEPLEVGQTFELTLTFEEAGEQTVTVEVRKA